MKFNIKPLIFGSMLFLLTGCQFANTNAVVKEASDEKITLNTEDNESANAEAAKNSQEITEDAGLEDEVSAESVSTDETSAFAIGGEQSIKDISIKLLNIREIVVDYIQANKDRFVGIELEIKNNGNELVEINSLPQIMLLADSENQDIALIETKGKIDKVIEPGEALIGEIAFDAIKAEQYQFIFKAAKSDELLTWNFSEHEIGTETVAEK